MAGQNVWRLIKTCARQVRIGPAGAFALDMPAFVKLGQVAGCDLVLLLDVLAEVEAIIIHAYRRDSSRDDD